MKNWHPTWQKALSYAITDFDELCGLLSLDAHGFACTQTTQQSFPLRVPRELIARMEIGNSSDPLLLQVLPQAVEIQVMPGFSNDPLQENLKNPIPGLLHKYHGRVLLTLTGACAINCRYCFRRHFPYADNIPSKENWQNIMNYIRDDKTIEEVIFSGGDPLVLKDALLEDFISQLESIPHLQRLRIHTRLPIVIPQRITDELVTVFKKTRFQKMMVVHCNHANEVDEMVMRAFQKIRDKGMILMNQSVLLKNINDNADTLIKLSKKLFESGVLPYYLFLLDKVNGAAHFDVPEKTAYELMSEMKKNLPGFLVPKLAREVSGMLHKDF